MRVFLSQSFFMLPRTVFGLASLGVLSTVTRGSLSALLSGLPLAEIDFGPMRILTYADAGVFASVLELKDAVLALGEISRQDGTANKKL